MATKFEVPAWEPSRTLQPIEQQVYLSLLGPKVWRMYRETGSIVSLVLPLFEGSKNDPFGEMFRGTHAMLRAIRDARQFATADALDGHVAVRLLAVTEALPYEFGLPRGLMRAVLDTVFADTQNLMVNLNELVTLMMECIEKDYPVEVLEPFTVVWFDLCDGAINLDRQVTV